MAASVKFPSYNVNREVPLRNEVLTQTAATDDEPADDLPNPFPSLKRWDRSAFVNYNDPLLAISPSKPALKSASSRKPVLSSTDPLSNVSSLPTMGRSVHFAHNITVKAFSPDVSSITLDSSVNTNPTDSPSPSLQNNGSYTQQYSHLPAYNASKYTKSKRKPLGILPSKSQQSSTLPKNEFTIQKDQKTLTTTCGTNIFVENNKTMVYNHWADFNIPDRDSSPVLKPTSSDPGLSHRSSDPGLSCRSSDPGLSFYQADDDDCIEVIASDLRRKPELNGFYLSKSTNGGSLENLVSLGRDKIGYNFIEPELNSIGSYQAQLEKLQVKQFDAATAVKDKLKKSSKARAKLEGKVTGALKGDDPQFEELISLDVQEDEITKRLEQVKIKPKLKKQEPVGRPPDLLEFYSMRVQKEAASTVLNAIPVYNVKSKGADTKRNLSLYRHLQAWRNL